MVMPVVPLIPVLLKPDLVLVGIWESGDRIHYSIKNQGSKASVASFSELWVSGAHKTPDDAVPVIAAGATVDRVFGYVFSCSLPLIKTVEVRLDVSNSNIESDETNNKASVPALCH